MSNRLTSEHHYRVRKHALLATLFLCCLAFSNCGRNKPATDNEGGNPFATAIGRDTNQILVPCRWSYKVEQSSPGEATLISTAKLDSGWILYSQHISNKGPQMKFTYDSLVNYKLVGDTEEGQSNKKYDPNLEMDVLYFENEAVFRQKIKVMSKEDFAINGAINYVACLTQCVFSDEEFAFEVKGNPDGK